MAPHLDWERFADFRRRVNRNTDRKVRRAALSAADHLRKLEGNLPLQETVETAALLEEVDLTEIIIYLATLGLGVLIASEEEPDLW